MDYRAGKRTERPENRAAISPQTYRSDVCPPVDSPEFPKMFPIDPSKHGFERVQAARCNGYGG
ncbi:MAG TPA: hypothetical protein VJH04_01885 [archaeon]|nr:hypothetical protein [archaeon]